MPAPTIGIIGTGSISRRALKSILNDQQAAADGPLTFVLPLDDDLYTDDIDNVVNWILDNDLNFEVVHTGDLSKELKEVEDQASNSHKVADVAVGIVRILAKAKAGKLFIFWNDEDEDGYRAFERADEDGVPAYDLCNLLELLHFGDDAEAPADEPEEEVDPIEQEEQKAAAAKVYTEDELLAMSIEPIKKIAKERFGITLPDRTRVKTYAAAILEAQELGGAPGAEDLDDGMAEFTATAIADGEDVPQDADDEEEVYVAPEDDDEIEIPTDDDPDLGKVFEETFKEPLGSSDGPATPNEENVAAPALSGVKAAALPWPGEWKEGLMLVGNCAGCGAPFLIGPDWRTEGVQQTHVQGCPIHNP